MADKAFMEQRRQPRFAANQAVAIRILGSQPATCAAVVRDASGQGLGLEVSEPIVPGTALEIEMEDTLLLGEVVYARPSPAGGSTVLGVRLQEALCGLAELARACLEFSASLQEPSVRTPSNIESASTRSNPQNRSTARS